MFSSLNNLYVNVRRFYNAITGHKCEFFDRPLNKTSLQNTRTVWWCEMTCELVNDMANIRSNKTNRSFMNGIMKKKNNTINHSQKNWHMSSEALPKQKLKNITNHGYFIHSWKVLREIPMKRHWLIAF